MTSQTTWHEQHFRQRNPEHRQQLILVERARYPTYCYYGQHSLHKHNDFVKFGHGYFRRGSFKVCFDCMPLFLSELQNAVNTRHNSKDLKQPYWIEVKDNGTIPTDH